MEAHPRNDQETVIQFIDDILDKVPSAVERIQTDDGQELGPALAHPRQRASVISTSSPALPAQRQGETLTPDWLRGFYRLLEGQFIDDAQLYIQKLQEWEDCYNFHRPRAPQRANT